MTDPANTTPAMLLRAARIGQEAGLRYVYAGNQPGRVGDYEHTNCHACGDSPHLALRLPDSGVRPDPGRRVSELQHPYSRPLECRVRRPDRCTSFPAARSNATPII